MLSRGAALEEAEEIAQAAWVRGWEFRDQLRDPGLVGFWVNSIARNLFRAKFRSKAPASMEGVEAPYWMDLEEIELHRLLDRCSGRDRQLLKRSLEGYSAEEIARSEGITSTGIRVRLLRIRQSLRQKLSWLRSNHSGLGGPRSRGPRSKGLRSPEGARRAPTA